MEVAPQNTMVSSGFVAPIASRDQHLRIDTGDLNGCHGEVAFVRRETETGMGVPEQPEGGNDAAATPEAPRDGERDPITGLMTGNEMMRVVRTYMERYHKEGGRPPQLAFLDIDRFTGLSSMLGEDGTRAFLKSYCARLIEAVGAAGEIARGSGDRFFVLFTDPTIREQLRGLFDQPIEIGGRNVYAPTSMGVALYPRDAEGPNQLVRCATLAMKSAKRDSPGTLVEFNNKMRTDAARSRQVEDCLRSVIDRPEREFRLVYQPKVDLKDGKVAGVEALMRWTSSSLGAVPPDEFIPVAESTRLILPLGRWLIETALSDLKRWVDDGYNLHMAINVSPVELKHGDFVRYLSDRVAAFGLPNEMIEVEITEGQLVADSVIDQLVRLRACGFQIAIDDFGRDQSNLSRVASLPATTLKIDKSLTDGLLDDRRQLALMKNIIALCDDLGLQSVIEGIETIDQARQLGLIGGILGQGFFTSKPIPANDLIRLVDERGETERSETDRHKAAG
jgi:EAL domain-containing protein (putative c-di-GMP-specific phosphodiesterase class I)